MEPFCRIVVIVGGLVGIGTYKGSTPLKKAVKFDVRRNGYIPPHASA